MEAALFKRERTLLDLPPTLVFYDLTNMHPYGRPRGDLQHGRSKQKRNDRPLMTLALALDGAGFPRRSEILPGNVSEPGTLAAALRRLDELPYEAGPRPTVVMDAGCCIAHFLVAPGSHWAGGELLPERKDPGRARIRIDAVSAA